MRKPYDVVGVRGNGELPFLANLQERQIYEIIGDGEAVFVFIVACDVHCETRYFAGSTGIYVPPKSSVGCDRYTLD